MKLTVKHFKKDQRIDVCDDYDNLINRWHYRDDNIDLLTITGVNAWVRGYREGWVAARNSIANCEASDRMIDVDAMYERREVK